jgi:hypothetical protein
MVCQQQEGGRWGSVSVKEVWLAGINERIKKKIPCLMHLSAHEMARW